MLVLLTTALVGIGIVVAAGARQPSPAAEANGETLRGASLFASRHCFYCHRIGSKGGVVGPALDRGRRSSRTDAYLRAHFKNPGAVTPGSVMPKIPLTEAEIDALVLYVRSLSPGAKIPAISLPWAMGEPTRPSVAEGRDLYRAAACRSCHAIGGQGVVVGPSLDSFGRSGRRMEWLLALFRDPDRVEPGTIMPAIHGTDRQLRSLALYLLSLKSEIAPTPALGQRIFAQRQCGHCHGDRGHGGRIGPRLSGARRPGRTDVWLLDHFRDPAAVSGRPTMPRVWASDWELQSLLEYLKTLWMQDVPRGRRQGA